MNRREFVKCMSVTIVGSTLVSSLLPKKKVRFQPNEIQAKFIKAMKNTYYCTTYRGRLVISGVKR